MTLGILFLVIVLTYLVLIAYGIAGMRKRHMVGRPWLTTAILIVVIPPALIAGLLALSGEGGLVLQWGTFLGIMPVTGALVAVATDQIVRRIQP